MADIELVVKIPERIHYGIEKGITVNGSKASQILIDAVKNGTLLPKGHGRLGDLDALREEVSSWGINDYEPSDFMDEIDRTDTIIEADKEQTDGNDN